MQKKVEIELHKIALKYRIPNKVAKAIVESQFYCAREEVKKGVSGEPDTFMHIKFKHLGRIIAKKGRVKLLKKVADGRRERLHSSKEDVSRGT